VNLSFEEVFEFVVQVIEDSMYVSISTITADTRLIEELGAESIDIVCISQRLENEFGHLLSAKSLLGVSTIGDIVEFLLENLDNRLAS